MYNRPRLGILPEHVVRSNPEYQCPKEILEKQVGIRVMFMAFNGSDMTGTIEVDRDVAQDVQDFFAYAYDLGFPITGVTPASSLSYNFDDIKLMDNDISSGFNYRTIHGKDTLSAHALGRAIDINPKSNPIHYFNEKQKMTHKLPARGNFNPKEAGTFIDNHELVVFMRERGWVWGGDWTKESGRVDRHHFEKRD